MTRFIVLQLIIGGSLILNCSPSKKLLGRGYVEKDGYIAVEAEDFQTQSLTDVRKWYRIDASYHNEVQPDHDERHLESASGSVYLEILPDTRKNREEKLIHEENFSNKPGKLGILNYAVKIKNPGKYYVWVRAFSSGSEDNGIHVGLDGAWPESGQRMQWCEGKNDWTWESKQRTEEVHCGEEKLIFLEIDEPGMHTISFSMREDGFEFDKWALSKVYEKPD